ncbi:MAG: hypothetical protein Q8Q94_02500 [bacterium]|nr:hypothetical protein [bacterium]MDZ4299770.1 hypothetical protein [Candidatus Sungbacteria bacterium]
MNTMYLQLAGGKWFTLSLAEQMGNIGSEVSRVKNWGGRDATLAEGAFVRALELLDLTIRDVRWRGRLKELVRVREVFCDTVMGAVQYRTTLEDLDRYLLQFAVAARSSR